MRLIKLILIRYNMAAPYVRQAAWYDGHRPHLDPDWLAQRKALFDRYCWPSIAAQSDSDFEVLVLFDEATPKDYVDAIVSRDRRLIAGFTTQRTGRDNSVFRAETQAAVRRYLTERSVIDGYLWTTRLDSDDVLGPKYLAHVRREVARRVPMPELSYFYFPRGQVYDVEGDTYYDLHYPNNAFGTLIERIDLTAIKTAYFRPHTHLRRIAHNIALRPKTGHWCMIVHGGNVLNSVRGKPMAVPFFALPRGEDHARTD